jgi:hypothetical protein
MNPTDIASTQPVVGLTYKARRDGLKKVEHVVFQGLQGGYLVVTDKHGTHYRAKRDSGITSPPTFAFQSKDLA